MTGQAAGGAGATMRVVMVALFALVSGLAGVFSLPPLDRDEARFAQATAQMLETGDFIAIRFQDDERNKKPAGIHWMQAASVAAFSAPEARDIWAYRLPSVLGAVIAAVMTSLIGARLYGRETGFLAGLLLAAAPAFAGESTIAKTDAMLLATVTAAQAALAFAFLRWRDGAPPGWGLPALFWGALGAGVLIKGPIAPMIVALTLAGVMARFRAPRFLLALRPLFGLAVLALMVAPWAVLIGQATEGRFFAEALGGDMAGKIGAAQERHGGPPGYHLLLLAPLMLPAAALIGPGLAQAIATRRAFPAWFLLSWIAPAWIVFELTATKLPHYVLPLYPALAILAARGASLGAAARRPLMRKAGAAAFLLLTAAAAAAVAALPLILSSAPRTVADGALALAVIAGAGYAARLFWVGRSYAGGLAASVTSLALALALLQACLPRLDRLQVSPRLSAALVDEGRHPLRDGAPPVALAGYAEPSAIFLLGTPTRLVDGAGAAAHLRAYPQAAVAVEARLDADFAAAAADLSLVRLAVIDGLNYSNGRRVRLTLYARAGAPQPTSPP